MTNCEHYNVIHYSTKSVCKRCGLKWEKEPPKRRANFTDEDRKKIAGQFGEARSSDFEPELVEDGVSKYRLPERTGTGFQEEKKEAKRIKDIKDRGLVEKDGMRRSMSIPADVYHSARSKYGKDCWQDRKFKKKFNQFSLTDE